MSLFQTSLFVSLIVSLAACTGKDATKTADLHKKRPESPVLKSVKHFVKDTSGKEMLLEINAYNKEGHKIRSTRYQEPNVLEYEASYTPGDHGHPVKTVTRYLDGSTETETHTYNDNDKPILTEWKRSDGTTGKHEYKYDDHDSMVQWDRYQNGKYIVSQLWPNVYADDNTVLESYYKETTNGRDTSTQTTWQYQYDSFGRIIHKLTISGNALSFAQQFHYDSLGSPVMIIEYGPDSTQVGAYIPQKRTINTFNEYGEMLSSIVLDISGKELSRVENEYDKYGHLIKSVTTVLEGESPFVETHRWEYEFY